MAGSRTTSAPRGGARKTTAPAKRRWWNYPRAGKGPVHRWVPSWRFVVGSFLFLVALGIGIVATAYVTTDIPEADEFTEAQVTTVYYADGETEMGRFSEVNRVIVDADVIPKHVKDAVVAAEDRTFYDNAGISPTGIARAFWVNIRGGDQQGGSTITQQYAERYYLGTTKDYVGKFQEALLAVKLAQSQDKDTVLANYLNTIYFGRGAYGIETAAQAYFGVPASELTVAQAALIAGVIPAPSAWDPRVSPEKAEQRWNYVLDGMVATGALSQAERDALEYPETIEVRKSDALGGPTGYLLEEARAEVLEKAPVTEEEIATRGLKIVTTIDPKMQQAVERTIAEEMPEDAPDNLTTAVVSVEPGTGAIRAMYGGKDYVAVQLNAATQDTAQAGSTFKPFTLVAALEDGITLDDTYDGRTGRSFEGFEKPVNNFGDYSPGWVSLLKATEQSVNTVYVDVNEEVTPEATRDVAVRAGIPEDSGDFEPVLSNVLGVAQVHAVDMAEAYATFAAQGEHAEPYIVQTVTDLDGGVVYEGGDVVSRVFEEDVMAETTYALTQVVENGSGEPAQELDRPVAGKTGTSNANRSAWFVGYTPQLSTAVMLAQKGEGGKQEPITPFGGYEQITGGSVPVELWTSYMSAALEGAEVLEFPDRPKPERPEPTATPSPEESEEPSEEPTDEETSEEPANPTVPSGLVGSSEEAARAALIDAGLEPVVRTEPGDQPVGTVIRVEPGEGTEVPQGSSIVLIVSAGPPEPTEPEEPEQPEEPSTEPEEPTAEPSDEPEAAPGRPEPSRSPREDA